MFIDAAFNNPGQRSYASCVPGEARQVTPGSSTAIAIHNNSDMAHHRLFGLYRSRRSSLWSNRFLCFRGRQEIMYSAHLGHPLTYLSNQSIYNASVAEQRVVGDVTGT